MPDIYASRRRKTSSFTSDNTIMSDPGVVTSASLLDQPPSVPADPTTKAPLKPVSSLAGTPELIVRRPEEYSTVLQKDLPTHNPIASYSPQPVHFRFSTQLSTEIVLLLLRQHPITQVGWIILALLAGFLPVLFSFVDFFADLSLSYQVGIYALWYLGLFGGILEGFLKWYYNVYIITDERIIDVDFHSLTYRDISAAAIDKIEDTTARTTGFLSALFDYGTVNIQTAAEKREFEFERVPHPNRVTFLINELIVEEEREKIEGRVN